MVQLDSDNAYEAQRQARILANQRYMSESGLLTAASSALQSLKPIRRVLTANRAARARRVLEPSRRSARAADQPAPSYKETELTAILVRQQSSGGRHSRHKARIGARSSTRIVPDNVDPGYSRAAVDAAAEAGDDLCASLENPAACKVMMQSMVSGGYWMQAPAAIVPCVGLDKKEVVFETTDTHVSTSWSDFRYSDEGSRPVTWHVMWLPRPSGAGFSGMWRGFAIDMELKVGDAVVWEVLDSDRIRVHIFRAAAYESDPLLRATLPNSGDGGVPDPGEELEAGQGSGPGSPGGSSGISSDCDVPDECVPSPCPQAVRLTDISISADDACAAQPAEAPPPAKRARVDAGDCAALTADAGIAAINSPAVASGATLAAASSTHVSQASTWLAPGRQAQVTDFMAQRKRRQGDDAGKGGAKKLSAPLQRPKHVSIIAEPPMAPAAMATATPAAASPAGKAAAKTTLAPEAVGLAAGSAVGAPQPRQQSRKQRAPQRRVAAQAEAAAAAPAPAPAAAAAAEVTPGNSPTATGAPVGPPPVRISEEGDGIYVVEGLVDKLVQGGETLWRVRWHGYTAADDTWEPTECLDMGLSAYKWLGAPDNRPAAMVCGGCAIMAQPVLEQRWTELQQWRRCQASLECSRHLISTRGYAIKRLGTACQITGLTSGGRQLLSI